MIAKEEVRSSIESKNVHVEKRLGVDGRVEQPQDFIQGGGVHAKC